MRTRAYAHTRTRAHAYTRAHAHVQVKEVDLGIVADLGTLQRLPHLVL